MKIFVGFDHRGRERAYKLIENLVEQGYDVNVPFDSSEEKLDYPDVAALVCGQVKKNKSNVGILFCGTGIGMVMAANKEDKIRAVLAQTEGDAYFARRHEDANVLVFPAGYTDGVKEVKAPRNIEKIVKTFIQTEFEAGRHTLRVKKLNNIGKE